MSVQTARQIWSDERLEIGGNNPLINFEPSSFGQVDLSRAHPGGLAQLVTSRGSRMTNLVRDGVLQSRALSATRRIKQRADRISANFGFDTVFIAGGLVKSTGDNRQLPVLLWPVTLIQRTDDYELNLGARPMLNPALVSLLRERRGDFVDSMLLDLVSGSTDLIPVAVLTKLSELLNTTDVDFEKLLVLGNFAPATIRLRACSLGEGSQLIDQLAAQPVDQLSADAPQPPAAPKIFEGNLTLVENADVTQQRVIRRALAGDSFAVETLPGCGYLQTVVNLIAQFGLDGRRVLVVAPRKQTLDELAERLSAAQLPGAAIRVRETWLDTVAAISRNEKAQPVAIEDVRDKLARAETAAAAYFAAVEAREPTLGVSLIEAIRKLAELSVLPDPPTNSARISSDLLPGILEAGLPLLEKAQEAGVFAFGPQDSAWYGARFENSSQISEALRIAKRLSGEEFRTLRYQINRYLEDQKLTPCNTVEEWAIQLRLLIGIRETLDKFRPEIYDRSLHELVAATAHRRERGDLSGAQRRRFRKSAKEFIRPGSVVADLHGALVQAQQQRELWQRFSLTQAPPAVPLGLADAQQKFESLTADLEALQRHLSPNPDFELLTRLPLDELATKLESLANRTAILDRLLERTAILDQLKEAGLQGLSHELAKLHPTRERVRLEFEQAWWQSALEAVVAADSRILEFGADRIADLESSFEQAAEQLIAQGAPEVREHLAANWKRAVAKHPAQADALRALLRSREITAMNAFEQSGPLWLALSSALLVSPYAIHEISESEKFDAVFVLDAASVGMAESVAAIARGSQIVAFGDPVIAVPENFETVARPSSSGAKSSRASVFEIVAKTFGQETISRSYRIDGQVLARYLNADFYDNRIIFEPTAAHYFGRRNYELVEISANNRATSTIEGSTESMNSEVEKVVELVMNHARWTPEDSLLVASASRSHADRIQAAVQVELQNQPQLAEFFDAHGREGFEVTTLSDLTHRLADRVIFSIGFGRTPEGRVSGNLGDLSSADAKRKLANLIVSARRRLTVVSCFGPQDVSGSDAAGDVLADLLAPKFLDDTKDTAPDPLLRDLSLRLQKLGLHVALGYAGRIGLVASHGQVAAVVDPDWGLVGDSWDEKLRLRSKLLKAMGWVYIRVHALEIFATPQDVAHRIAKQLGVDIDRKPEPLFEISQEDGVAFEDTSRAWGDGEDSNDRDLRENRPPHWG